MRLRNLAAVAALGLAAASVACTACGRNNSEVEEAAWRGDADAT